MNDCTYCNGLCPVPDACQQAEPSSAPRDAAKVEPVTALRQILAAVQFEQACPRTFDFSRCEQLCRAALGEKT